MTEDRVETLYHLTPRGWIRGSVDTMWEKSNTTVTPPTDRVETWEHKLYQRSIYSPEENSWTMIWSSPKASAEVRRKLHERFPHEYDGRFQSH
jgi:hypothetical protein